MRKGQAQFQGSDPKWFSTALKGKLLRAFEGGSSYRELAWDCNFDLLVFLLWSADHSRDPAWSAAGWIFFSNLMDAFAYGPSDIQQWFEEGQASLHDGILPWKLTTGPITKARMTDVLAAFRANLESGKIVLPRLPSLNEIDNKLGIAQAAGYWHQAAEALKPMDPKDFAAYEQRFLTRTNDILWAPFPRKVDLNSG